MVSAGVLLVAVAALAAPAPCPDPKTPGAPPRIVLRSVADGFASPIAVEHAGDGTGRLFVVEQAGKIRLLKGGVRQPGVFLDIESKVRSGGEMGLLGLAFHPKYAENGRFIVNYTSPTGGLHTVIAEYRVSGTDPDRADPQSERIVLVFDQPWENHNGGDVKFGPDGMLYIGTGDGGAGNDPRNVAQNLGSVLGKMLRIDVDRKDAGLEYAVPPDNPFLATKGARPEVWAYGLRNPWRYAFDPVTGWLWAGDVGQNHWEEVDIVRRGGNYGWRKMEGLHCTPGINKNCDKRGCLLPVHEYPRRDGNSVTGGRVYRGAGLPGLCGAYVFGDFGSGKIWALRSNGKVTTSRHQLLNTSRSLSAFGEDEDRELYVLDYGGELLRFTPAP